MNEDQSHLDLLSIFHLVLGCLHLLVPCFLLIQMGIGIAMLSGAMEHHGNGPPRLLGLFFIIFPGCMMTLGWLLAILMLVASVKLKRRRAHTFCLVVAAIECLLMPLGTILGIFTVIVLMRESVKQLFAANTAGHG